LESQFRCYSIPDWFKDHGYKYILQIYIDDAIGFLHLIFMAKESVFDYLQAFEFVIFYCIGDWLLHYKDKFHLFADNYIFY